MNLAQLKARLQEVAAKLTSFEAVENITEEHVTEINKLSDEFESLKTKIEAREKVERATAQASSSQRQTSPSAPAATHVEVVPSKKDRQGGFENFGEFLMAVKSSNTNLDKRFQNAMFERNGEDGGFLVPEEFIPDVSKKLQSDESLLARARQLTVSGNALSLPVDETAPWNGGIQAYWMSEGNPYTESKSKLGLASWKLNKLGVLVPVSDELLEDATALSSYITNMAPEAIMHKVNGAMIAGDGVGKMKGIINSTFKVKVAKESGQAADTLVARNVIKMYSALIPSSRVRAVWLINAGVEPQLRTMKDDQGAFIYLAPGSQMNQSPYGLLMGLPVISMIGSMKELGTEGDIVLADFAYYYTIIKAGGMKSAVSQHLYFDRDLQAFKFTMRIDGSAPFKAPITTEFGNYQMSAFVTLEDR